MNYELVELGTLKPGTLFYPFAGAQNAYTVLEHCTTVNVTVIKDCSQFYAWNNQLTVYVIEKREYIPSFQVKWDKDNGRFLVLDSETSYLYTYFDKYLKPEDTVDLKIKITDTVCTRIKNVTHCSGYINTGTISDTIRSHLEQVYNLTPINGSIYTIETISVNGIKNEPR